MRIIRARVYAGKDGLCYDDGDDDDAGRCYYYYQAYYTIYYSHNETSPRTALASPNDDRLREKRQAFIAGTGIGRDCTITPKRDYSQESPLPAQRSKSMVDCHVQPGAAPHFAESVMEQQLDEHLFALQLHPRRHRQKQSRTQQQARRQPRAVVTRIAMLALRHLHCRRSNAPTLCT